MKQVSQKQLTNHIGLVKWQETKTLLKFNLLTIHSLLLNSHPKFIQLKKVIEDYNNHDQKTIGRKHLKQEYAQKIYQMLSQMILIPNYQNQFEFLNKVYIWAFQANCLQSQQSQGKNSRPTTASTRTRPFSAYSRPKSGVSTKIGLVKQLQAEQLQPTNKVYNFVDYDKLQPGNIQFYNGMRTLHSEEERTKKKLKQYQRKIFYEEQDDSDVQVIQLQQQNNERRFVYKSKIPIIQPVQLVQPQLEQKKQGENQQNIGQQAMQIGEANEEDVNVDDIPLEGDQALQQAEEVVDKLKPRFKAFIKHQTQLSKNHDNFQSGINQIKFQRNQIVRKFQEDLQLKNNATLWAKQKSRTERQKKRRAQSARIVTKKIGISTNQEIKKQSQNINQINFQNTPVFQVGIQRPKTAFKAFNQKNRKQIISNCFMTSKLQSHVTLEAKNEGLDNRFMRITSCAERPKKKTFEQILRQAQKRVVDQTQQQLINVKETLAKNKVAFQANRIAKSITYHSGLGVQMDQKFSGLITGMNLPKNPFIKVTKKKKKKKKK